MASLGVQALLVLRHKFFYVWANDQRPALALPFNEGARGAYDKGILSDTGTSRGPAS
jgi:hypothetical protein